MADNPVSHDANPGSKRPRTAGESSLAGSAGKGITKSVSKWALQKIAAVHSTLARKAQQLSKSYHNDESAHSHLEELSAAGKVPSSLRFKLTPAQLARLPRMPGAKEEVEALEKRFVEQALEDRRTDAAKTGVELSDILTGDTFADACKEALSFDKLSAKLRADILPLIEEAEEDFKGAMEVAQADLKQRAAKEKAAAAQRAAAKERHSMEMDQSENDKIITRVVQEQLTLQLPKLLKKKQQQNVRFDTRGAPRGRKQSPAQRRGRSPPRGQARPGARRQTPARGSPHPSRGRSQSRGWEAPRGRRQTPARSARNGPSTPRSVPSAQRGHSQQRSWRQSREPPRGDSKRSAPRSTSRPRSWPPINRQGGRGARPHRSPSAWHDGGGQSGGGSGSRTGARR